MSLFNKCKQWLLDDNNDDIFYECSDGGYILKIVENDDDSIKVYYNGATCYGVSQVNAHSIQIGIDTINDEHIVVWFVSQIGHGKTHITDIDSFKWYITHIL